MTLHKQLLHAMLTIVIQEQMINSTEHIRLRGRHIGIVADVVSSVDDSFRLLLRIYCLELLVVIGVMSETSIYLVTTP